MPYYYGKIKCIYIDPPYNTGNEGWGYNTWGVFAYGFGIWLIASEIMKVKKIKQK